MSNLRRSGDASMHCLAFQAFLEDDPRFMEFLLAVNDNILMGDIKSDPNAQLSWMMPKTQEYYKFKGKFYIASAPIQVTRFPPPNVTDHASSASQYWEDERQRQWKALDPAVRATFTWPSRGEVPKMDPKAFACQRLEFPADTTASSDQLLHGIAMDNFCLLVFKIIQVEHFDHVTFPPQRKVITPASQQVNINQLNRLPTCIDLYV
ncbi:uncharacterized protein BYT42DRAFT_494212 [Radiomyces spectabilis]|uniref:uncharacterized protein n=1 Tax=Radiomyces spectabilis TaxID=64574 RepID=UPI00221F2934|nr:uncharacterized protein BYT42DRAFT_494212 [Radiomyces spectabilis]KAI8381269.1 hypothetical protein BYT42DRAFT_494212 [Radiomyces spectabilis]